MTEATEANAAEATGPVQAGPVQAGPVQAGPVQTSTVRPNKRKVREGMVVSVAMDKTAIVQTSDRVRHPRYNKIVRRRNRLYVHDQNNELRVGDRVRIQETRPLSKTKRWRLVEVTERVR